MQPGKYTIIFWEKEMEWAECCVGHSLVWRFRRSRPSPGSRWGSLTGHFYWLGQGSNPYTFLCNSSWLSSPVVVSPTHKSRRRARKNIRRAALNMRSYEWSSVFISYPFCFVCFNSFRIPVPASRPHYDIHLGERNWEKFTHLCSRSLAVSDLKFLISSVSRVYDMW